MIDLESFEKTLSEMSTRSRAFLLVKKEMQARGHWKNKARRIPTKDELLRLKSMQFVPSSMYKENSQQSSTTDWGA